MVRDDQPWQWTCAETVAQMDAGRISSVEVTRAYLDRIRELDGEVHGYLHVAERGESDAESALGAARRSDERRAAGEQGPLLGVPIAIKDIICVRGMRNTCGSRILEDFVPPYDATVVTRLRDAGAVILGKTNLDEFAMGSSTENSAYGPTRNPWDLERVPGGSSGGSAAVVAAGEAPAALGTDTGGSIRQPAAFCGVTGLKPTYGRVSRYGLVAYASSLDQAGPLARDAADCATLLQVMAGHDPMDSTSLPLGAPLAAEALRGGVQGLRLGLPVQFTKDLDRSVARHVEAAVKALETLGARVEEVDLPHMDHALAAYYIIAPAEASSNLARYDGTRYGHRVPDAPDCLSMSCRSRREGFGAEVKRRIMLGTYALSAGYYDAYYLKAQQVRTLVRRDFEDAFARVDAIVGPVAPQVAFRIGEKVDDPLAMYQSDVYTIAVNLAGLPALVVPCGFEEGLPVGLQLIGPALSEARLLGMGHGYQQATAYHLQRPRLGVSSLT